MPRALVSPPDAAVPIELEYDTTGDPADPAVLLVHGTGVPMVAWTDETCMRIAGCGYHVIRFDNRDIGRSTKVTFQHDPADVILAAIIGGEQQPAYTAVDMAADAVGLLDHLGIEEAHVVGVSLGGSIAQWMAIDHPTRVASLTLVMTSTGEPHVGQPDPEVVPALLHVAEPGLDGAIEHALIVQRTIAGDRFDPEETRARTTASWEHADGPQNVTQQLAAGLHTPPTADRLPGVTAPTLVVHGALDRLIDPSGGRRLAELIPGAELQIIDGMGHDLPAPVRTRVFETVLAHVRRATAARTSGSPAGRRVPSEAGRAHRENGRPAGPTGSAADRGGRATAGARARRCVALALLAALVTGILVTAAAPAAMARPASAGGSIGQTVSPEPIVFVHGWRGSPSKWDAMRSRFAAAGFPSDRMFSFGYHTGQNIRTSASQLSAYVDQVRAETGSAVVDIVAHSQGALVARWCMKAAGCDGDGGVDDWVSLAGANHGTLVSLCFWSTSCRQMFYFSDFVDELNADDETPGSATYTAFWSGSDPVILPNSSARLADGATNIQINVGHDFPISVTVFNALFPVVVD